MQNFVKEIISRLSQAGVEFIVVGGASAVLQGAPVVTLDLDLCYRRSPENIRRLAEALAPLTPKLRGLPPDVPFTFDERTLLLGTNFTLDLGGESLDLLAEMSAIGGYEQVVKETEELTVAGWRVKVLSLSQLIATKEAAGRLKDLATLPVLRATLEMKQKRKDGHDPSAGA